MGTQANLWLFFFLSDPLLSSSKRWDGMSRVLTLVTQRHLCFKVPMLLEFIKLEVVQCYLCGLLVLEVSGGTKMVNLGSTAGNAF